jgi:hypothetical protein
MRVYTTGVFDILRRGQLNILTQAAAPGELTVGVMTDQGVEDTKGLRPILTLEEREAHDKGGLWKPIAASLGDWPRLEAQWASFLTFEPGEATGRQAIRMCA